MKKGELLNYMLSFIVCEFLYIGMFMMYLCKVLR